MRNLKKILALVLALVMSFSLMATANAFTDSEKITDTYETAVTVLDGLKVFQGYDDGSFQPQGSITRAEVATIIYRIVTGDVEGKQVGIYADYNKFDDVKSTSWYAGYVNFCANAEYIKGYDAKTFGPNDPVTGYQALAMILRALGYDKNGEFTGASWQVQTAAVGENRGITKNISAGTLGTAATREVVAEILFRAILVEKVNYTPAFGYQLDDTSIGWDTFELEEIEGVVVANEYADLYDTDTLKAGKTELNVDGESYVIDYTSTLEDIGEARYAYITEGKTVLALGDAGNTVFETGAEADIKTNSKFEDVTGLERGDAEEFINFDGGNEYKASDWKIKYVVEFANGDATVAFENKYGVDIETVMDETAPGSNEFEKTIKAGNTITNDDLTIIKYIFNEADKDDNDFIKGEVYVGTQSTTDISDELSYNQFKDKYIETAENAEQVNENENGNWLKVIDNDGDGEADYVLKTIYTVTGVEDIAKDGEITLSCDEESLDTADALNRLDEDDDIDVVAEDELAEGDVVYYAVIDGNAYTYKAEVVTAEIEKVNRNTLTATTTDGDEYIESGVCEHTYWDEITSGVRNLEGDVNYDLYLDKFGYLAAFTESVNNAGFVLITDGYYQSGRTEDTYAAMVWDGEDLVDTDITSGGSTFIRDLNNANGWGKLRYIDGVNYIDDIAADDIHTVVAALSEDGKLTPVDDLYRYREDVVMIGLEPDEDNIPDRSATIGYIYDSDDAAYDSLRRVDMVPVEADVRGLSSTIYYFVYNTNDGTVVREYVGYANVPELGNDADKIENIYAVASRATDANDNDYYTAEIVVVEMEDGYNQIDREEIFLLDLPEVYSSISKETATVIRANGEMQDVTIDLAKSNVRAYNPAWGKWVAPGLYFMWESADEDGVYVIESMTPADIAASDYLAGTVNKSTATGGEDWTSVDAYENDWYDYDADLVDTLTASYAGYEDSKRNTEDSHYYIVSYDVDDGEYYLDIEANVDWDDALPQDVRGQDSANSVLIAYDKNDILYAISFRFETVSTDVDDHFTEDVFVWSTPAADETPAPVPFSVSFYGVEDGDATDLEATANEITVSYKTASDYTGEALVVTGADYYVVTPENVAVDTDQQVYNLVAYVGNTRYDYTLTQNAACDVAELETDNAATTTVGTLTSNAADILVLNGNDPAYKLTAASVNADVSVNGNTVTVTSESGKVTNVYTIVYGSNIIVNAEDPVFVKNGTSYALPDEGDVKYYTSSNVADNGQLNPGIAYNVTAGMPGTITFTGHYDVTMAEFGSTGANWYAAEINEEVAYGEKVTVTVAYEGWNDATPRPVNYTVNGVAASTEVISNDGTGEATFEITITEGTTIEITSIG